MSNQKKRKRMKKLVSKVHINEDGEMGEIMGTVKCAITYFFDMQ